METDKKQIGFTLIELMVTIAVAAVLLTIAVPSFRTFVQSSRLSTQANSIVSALNTARSEAIKRDGTVDVVADSNGWSNGWTVQLDDGTGNGGGTLLDTFSGLNGGTNLTTNAGTSISFDALGQAGSAAQFEVSLSGTGNSGPRYVCVSPSGDIQAGTSTCD